MKILLIILTSLSTALSKPALLEKHIHGFETTLNLPGFTSVKKVPTSMTDELRKLNDDYVEENIYANNEMLVSPMEVNSDHESNTPTKMKNRMRFRVYRNSGDEDALNDSPEKCKKQVQLKFCEDGSEIIPKMRHDNTIVEARLMTKDDMEERIKMAKEALEHLRKYLREESSSKIKILDPEQELQNEQSQQEEYEVFHSLVKNMSNFQSMNERKFNDTKVEQSRVTSGDESRLKQIEYDFEVINKLFDDYVTHVHDTRTESNEEKKNMTKLAEIRMNQWKDNIERIQKNVVTGINIEDRFKSEKDNNDVITSFQTRASEKADAISPLKLELSADEDLHRKLNLNEEVHNEEKMFKNNQNDEEIIMSQDISSSNNLHSDNLRLDSGIIVRPETPELTLKSNLSDTEQNDVTKYNDHKSESFENRDNSRADYFESMNSKTNDNNEMKINKLQEQEEIKEESSIMTAAENLPQNSKSVTDLNNELSNPDNDNLNENIRNETIERVNKEEMRKSEATIARLITENNDLKNGNKFKYGNSQSVQENSEIKEKPKEDVPVQEHTPFFAKENFNTMKSLSTTIDTNSPILSHPQETSTVLEDIYQPKKNEDANVPKDFDDVLNTPRWLTHTNNVQHMKTVEDNNKNEVTQALFKQHTQNIITAKKAKNQENINDPLLQKLNGHVAWAQIRDEDIRMPQTLTNVNINQNVMKPGMQSDGSEMIRFDKIYERNDVNGKKNTQWIQEPSVHENSRSKHFQDQFHQMPAFRASHPDFYFKNSETDFLRPSDSRLTNERFANDVTNLHDNSFSSVMIPIHHERIDDGDNMVQASEHMRQLTQKSAMDYEQSWYNRHGMARASSYNHEQINAPSSAGSSAVGLFPNANTGGCGIPLLVSCSPSVISGTLAKGQPSYSTHSYGSTDNYKYHKKRETKNNYNVDVNETNNVKILNKKVEPAVNKVDLFKTNNL